MKYRRKTEFVEAMQLTKDNQKDVLRWMNNSAKWVDGRSWDPVNIAVKVHNAPGPVLLQPGDYIMKVDDEFEVVPKERFEMDWEAETQTPFRPGEVKK